MSLFLKWQGLWQVEGQADWTKSKRRFAPTGCLNHRLPVSNRDLLRADWTRRGLSQCVTSLWNHQMFLLSCLFPAHPSGISLGAASCLSAWIELKCISIVLCVFTRNTICGVRASGFNHICAMRCDAPSTCLWEAVSVCFIVAFLTEMNLPDVGSSERRALVFFSCSGDWTTVDERFTLRELWLAVAQTQGRLDGLRPYDFLPTNVLFML